MSLFFKLPSFPGAQLRTGDSEKEKDPTSLLRSPGPQPLFLLAQLGGERFAEIFRRKHLTDFDLVAIAERRALHPVDRFIERFGVDQPEAGDEIARERETDRG